MKNMPIRLMLLVLIGSVLLLITHCAPAPVTPQAPPTQVPSTPPTLAPATGSQSIVTLSLSDWHLTEPHWEKAIKKMMIVFEKEHPNIRVQLDPGLVKREPV